jgi:hypothetical protein
VARLAQPTIRFYYRPKQGQHVVSVRVKHELRERLLAQDSLEPDRSILAQRRDPDIYPELAWVARNYDRIRLYREWTFGRHAVFREPQKADLRNDMLEEDFSNMEAVHKGMWSRGFHGGRTNPVQERSVMNFHKTLYGKMWS